MSIRNSARARRTHFRVAKYENEAASKMSSTTLMDKGSFTINNLSCSRRQNLNVPFQVVFNRSQLNQGMRAYVRTRSEKRSQGLFSSLAPSKVFSYY